MTEDEMNESIRAATITGRHTLTVRADLDQRGDGVYVFGLSLTLDDDRLARSLA